MSRWEVRLCIDDFDKSDLYDYTFFLELKRRYNLELNNKI